MKVFVAKIDDSNELAVLASNVIDAYKIVNRVHKPKKVTIAHEEGYELLFDAIGLGEASVDKFVKFLAEKLENMSTSLKG